MMSDLSSLVTIGICTKDRWADLDATLHRLVSGGFGNLTLQVVDDGSNTACPYALDFWPGPVTLRRFEHPAGYIVRRNHLAKQAQTTYLLSLDDDSYPVAGSLGDAVAFAEACEDLLCLGFTIYNPVGGAFESRATQPEPYPVRAFIGCGHLMHVPRFLSLGGYREEMTHQGEEMELAARALQRGWRCFHYPDLTIHHTASNKGRNWSRMDYYGARNSFWWNDWFVPAWLRPLQQTRTFVGRGLHLLKLRRAALWKGMVDGLVLAGRYRRFRQPFTMRQYRSWRRLPPH
ncbi:MAG: glycosyltransferase [Verrucomicrobia bacterium]|nr:glycosyltransferase [Verrucomicrobiota bacterium]